MDYPFEFSNEARARIEAERIKAFQEFDETRRNKVTDGWTNSKWDRSAFFLYVLRAFLAFGKEACRLVSMGTWPVDRGRAETEEFLRIFTIDAYYHDGQDRSGHKFSRMTGDADGSL